MADRTPMAKKKQERNLEIVHQVMDLERPAADVASEFGISRARVSQICRTPRSWQAPMDVPRKERKFGGYRQTKHGTWRVEVHRPTMNRQKNVATEDEAKALLDEWRREFSE